VRGRRRGGGASRRRGRHRHHRTARRRAGHRPDRPILDPEKSIFVAFAPSAAGAAPPYEPGRFGWERLRTSDVAAAAEFYAATFGWQVTVGEGGGVVGVAFVVHAQ
jgi:hypothetical protein